MDNRHHSKCVHFKTCYPWSFIKPLFCIISKLYGHQHAEYKHSYNDTGLRYKVGQTGALNMLISRGQLYLCNAFQSLPA